MKDGRALFLSYSERWKAEHWAVQGSSWLTGTWFSQAETGQGQSRSVATRLQPKSLTATREQVRNRNHQSSLNSHRNSQRNRHLHKEIISANFPGFISNLVWVAGLWEVWVQFSDYWIPLPSPLPFSFSRMAGTFQPCCYRCLYPTPNHPPTRQPGRHWFSHTCKTAKELWQK